MTARPTPRRVEAQQRPGSFSPPVSKNQQLVVVDYEQICGDGLPTRSVPQSMPIAGENHEMDDVWAAVAAERVALADLLDQIDDAAWSRPSLCGGWTVRDVVGHLVVLAEAKALSPADKALDDEALCQRPAKLQALVQAWRYRETLARIEFAPIISGSNNDDPAWKPWTDGAAQEQLIKRFKKPLFHGRPEKTDPLAFLVVKSMLLKSTSTTALVPSTDWKNSR